MCVIRSPLMHIHTYPHTHSPNLQSDSGSSTNTADRILDLLKEQGKQQQVLRRYRGCGEPDKVKCAVRRGRGSVDYTSPLPLHR